MWETTVGSVSAPREREQNGVPRSIFTLSFQPDVFSFKTCKCIFLNKEYIIPKELVTRRAEYNPFVPTVVYLLIFPGWQTKQLEIIACARCLRVSRARGCDADRQGGERLGLGCAEHRGQLRAGSVRPEACSCSCPAPRKPRDLRDSREISRDLGGPVGLVSAGLRTLSAQGRVASF